MPLILGCLALFFPRMVIVLTAIFSDYLGRAFHNEWWWPLLGFFFLPFTTLAYAFAVNQGGGVHGLYLVLVVVAVLLDLGVIGGNAKAHRTRKVVVRQKS
jgi:hypothetical protein